MRLFFVSYFEVKRDFSLSKTVKRMRQGLVSLACRGMHGALDVALCVALNGFEADEIYLASNYFHIVYRSEPQYYDGLSWH